ncbi:unnamed protein product [Ascophyllum nodosum]
MRSYTGKEGFPTIAYQVTVDHSGRVLAVTRGFAGAHNDKTIVRYDDAVQQIRENATYTERVLQLRGKNGELIDCKGNYLIVDNGYHKWRVLQEPSKYPTTPEDTQYSKQLESTRKDVECFFGILKGRFRILKLPLLYRSKEAIDNVFFTSCILHNMLHEYDGMDQLEAGVH